ncbi:MAG: SIS domain-containing protein [Candidatus Nanohalobium sp.]
MIKAREELGQVQEVIRKTEEKRKEYEEKTRDLEFEKVFLTGCGSSYKISMMVASEMKKSGLEAEALEASEIIFSSQNIDEDSLVIGFSQSGETSETAKALEKANELGAKTLGVLNTEDSTIEDTADNSIFTPAGKEEAVLATKSVDSALRAGLVLKDIFTEEETEKIELDESLETDISEIVDILKTKEKAYCLGIGSFKGLAGEAATKLGEGPLIHANYMSSLEFSHGPKSHAKDLPVIVFALQPGLESTYREFLQELDDSGATTLVLSPESVSYRDVSEIEISVPEGLFSALKVVQRLAVDTAMEKGLNPDNPPNLSKHVEKKNL